MSSLWKGSHRVVLNINVFYHILIEHDIRRVSVGGHSVLMGEGALDIVSSEEDR